MSEENKFKFKFHRSQSSHPNSDLNNKIEFRNFRRSQSSRPESDSTDSVFLRKSKTYETQYSLIDGVPTEEVISQLNRGTLIHKVRGLDRFYCRRYFVDTNNMRLLYSPSQKHYLCRDVPYVDLCDLSEIRKGWNTDRFNTIQSRFHRKLHASIQPKNLPNLKEENCFSLIYENNTETIDLVAPDTAIRDLWVKGMSYLIAICKNYTKENEYEVWLRRQFRKADTTDRGSLNFNEILVLLNQINISMHKKHAKALFNVANVHKSRLMHEETLDPDEFIKFYEMLISRPEVEALFKKYSVNSSTIMGPDELMNFLKKEQNMQKITIEDCEAYIRRYEPKETQVPGYMSHKGFTNLLMSIDFDIFNRSHRIVCQDMSQPLSQYYIASSHNTYLLEGQLIGESSVEGYIKALLRGCRCVELDVWDGDNNEPIIFHGHTLTSKIYLRNVLDAIRTYAFKVSQYPVILSIENHCSVEQQKKMAFYFNNILKDYLYRTPVSESETELPSPESLARKILIKGKKLSVPRFKRSATIADIHMGSESASEDEGEDDEVDADDVMDEENNERKLSRVAASEHQNLQLKFNSTKKQKTAQEFSDVINYCSTRKFVSFEDCQKWKFYEMSSFVETKSEELAESNGKGFAKFNKKHLSRIYPKGLRTDSSNYKPIPHWNVGCQLVALNYQTISKPMVFNEALFSLNGRCGYVLKPEVLRRGKEYGVSARSSVPNSPSNKIKKVKIEVISGQHIPKPKNTPDADVVDPYVKVKVYGHSADKNTFKTKIVKNNGFNPIWNETFEFMLRLPEYAFIYFEVKDQNKTGKDITLGQYVIAFQAIMGGYRHVHLLDEHNIPIVPASLFVHVSFEDVADSWSPY